MQTPLLWGIALSMTLNMSIIDTIKLVSIKSHRPNINPKIYIIPCIDKTQQSNVLALSMWRQNKAKQSKVTPNASRWNMVALGNTRFGIHIGIVEFVLSVFFSPMLLPDAIIVSGGIWA